MEKDHTMHREADDGFPSSSRPLDEGDNRFLLVYTRPAIEQLNTLLLLVHVVFFVQ